MTHKILIVEDEPDLLKGLEINLAGEGYTIVKASSGDAALRLALKENPHLILMDIMLPGVNGLDVCRDLRQKGFSAPIIMLTAKAEEIDRVLGLELGADDYITKPFGLRELLARIRVQLRRRSEHPPDNLSRYRFNSVDIDFDRHQTTRHGKPVVMTAKEFDILRLMVRRRGEVISRDVLLSEVWGYEAAPTTRTVDNHILKLRQKLEDDPANPRFILSVYGEGYKFVG